MEAKLMESELVKMKEAQPDPDMEKKDRIRLAIFKKRQEEDSSFIEKLLQQSREKQEVPGLTRKSRRFSGNILPPQRRSKEENLEKMVQDLHCGQCHRTFKDEAQAKDEKENKSDEESNMEIESKENVLSSSSSPNLTPRRILSEEISR